MKLSMKLAQFAVLVAASAMASAAFAGQQHGRDSVYANATSSWAGQQSAATASTPRHGRDSVYATGQPVRSTPVVAGNKERFGRA